MIPAQRHPGEREPATTPLRRMSAPALFTMIPRQRCAPVPAAAARTSSPSPAGRPSAGSPSAPNPVLVARMAPRPPRRLAGLLAVVVGAGFAVVMVLVLVVTLGALA